MREVGAESIGTRDGMILQALMGGNKEPASGRESFSPGEGRTAEL